MTAQIDRELYDLARALGVGGMSPRAVYQCVATWARQEGLSVLRACDIARAAVGPVPPEQGWNLVPPHLLRAGGTLDRGANSGTA